MPRNSEGLYLLQRVRDEAHRFAIAYHRSKRSKRMTASALDSVPGLGEHRRKALVTHFGSIARLKEATVDQITAVPGIGVATANAVLEALRPDQRGTDGNGAQSMTSDAAADIDVVLVTGLSGAGRGTAAKVLEDLGWYVADNLPPQLITRMVDFGLAAGSRITQLAVVMDVRSRGFTGDLDSVRNELATRNITPRVVFMEASDDMLVRRYEQNRRSHPLQGEQTLAEGIAAERRMLAPVRATADLIIDTSTLSVRGLRDSIERAFGGDGGATTSVTVESFGFKYGLPMDADMVMDVRFLPNPHWVDELRELTGQHPAVRDYVLGQNRRGRVSRDLPSIAIPGCRGLSPGGEAIHDGRHRLHRRQAPQRRDRRSVDAAAGVGPSTVGAGAAPGSGSRMSEPTSPAQASSTQSIVALGGGHGLYATLSAARRLTPYVTAVVTVADDGGSSGRLRNELDVVPPGDLRMALAALASDSPYGRLWATILQHRFGGDGALAGHPIGNLMLAGLSTRCWPIRSPRSTSSDESWASRAGCCRCARSRCRSRPTSPGWKPTRGCSG